MDIEKIRTFYERLEPIVEKLQDAGKIDTPIKEGGWTPKQLIHHLADAQTMAFYRIMWMVTEDNTTIKPFNQDDWVATTDSHPVEASMAMIKGTYTRWYHLMKDMDASMYDKKAHHPEIGEVVMKPFAEYYIGHGESHISQFSNLLD